MNIELKKLTLQNFKGAKNLTVEFTERTSVMGANATGKTRLFDAWNWLLFGKDSEDKNDFSIKSLDKNNNPLHRADHSVKGILIVNGMSTTLERIYREKWTKKRGEETMEFTGHESAFFVDGVPYQLKDYQKRIESYLPEMLFKQITNPLFFNSMHWELRREMLFIMAGNIKDSEVIAANPELRSLLDHIIEGQKSLEDFKKELSASKKLLKEEIMDIPARIDEVNNAVIPEPDFLKVESDIAKIESRISEIDILINSEAEKYNTANKENQERQNKIFAIKQQIINLQFEDRAKAESANQDIILKRNRLASELHQAKGELMQQRERNDSILRQKSALEDTNTVLREEWSKLNEKEMVFDDSEFTCPACKRPFESDDIEAKKEELTINFNKSKTQELQKITSKGQSNARDIGRYNDILATTSVSIEELEKAIYVKQADYDGIIIPDAPTVACNPKINLLQNEIIEIEKSFIEIIPADNSKLLLEKKVAGMMLDEAKKLRTIKDENARHRNRLKILSAREQEVSQLIADLEKMWFQCENFSRAKVRMVEEKINSLFSIVKFKMFKTLVNGATEEICETLIEGVPYSDANNASRIQGGLDIINALSRHYDVYAPIWVDNRESVTKIPVMDCQVISLYVDSECAELKVVTEKELVETI